MPRQSFITYGPGGSEISDNIIEQYEIEVNDDGNPTEFDDDGNPIKHSVEGN